VVVAAFKMDDHATTSMAKNFQAGVFAAVVDSATSRRRKGRRKRRPNPKDH